MANIEDYKRATIAALLSDEILVGGLVLKGGNALDLAYNLSNRGSVDIDFSMEGEFSDKEFKRITNQLDYLLNQEFNRLGLKVFDISFFPKPEEVHEDNKDFWGGYKIEFKTIALETWKKHEGDLSYLQRSAIQIGKNGSSRFTVDISKYEFIGKTKWVDIEGASVRVYTPEMLAIEKLRALCQQIAEYKEIIHTATRTSRARDFYDIYNLAESFSLDFSSTENIQLVKNIFEAKKVPLYFICKVKDEYDFHEGSWESVLQTVRQSEEMKPFDFYFKYVLEKFSHLC